MTSLCTKIIGLTLLLPLLLGAGCDRSSAPPVPLAMEEFPAAFDKVFGKANPEAKELANQIVASMQAKDYSKAFQGLQSLLGRPDLTKEQASIMSRGLLTVNTLLQAAQAQGDAKAAQTIKVYQQTK